jgi:hypothetical protein
MRSEVGGKSFGILRDSKQMLAVLAGTSGREKKKARWQMRRESR